MPECENPDPSTMDVVAGLMEKMILSKAEREDPGVDGGWRWIEVGKTTGNREGSCGLPINAEGLGQTLGKVWCLIRGIDCKDLESNHFLFTFRQSTGKRRALEDGLRCSGRI